MQSFSLNEVWAFVMFAIVSSVTPGPNNIMMMSSALNYGIRRSLPHLFGICLGFGFMVFATGMGLHELFVQYPMLQVALKYLGALYLLWLALRIGMSSHYSFITGQSQGNPFTFLEAAIFQWVNPKAWVMALGALTAFLPTPSTIIDVMLLAGLYALVGLPCVAIWACFGSGLRQFLANPFRLTLFNWLTACLLIASIYPILTN